MENERINDQILSLERRLRRTQLCLLCALLVPVVLALAGWAAQSKPDVLRVKGLVVVDEQGRDRIILGAPMPASETRKRKDTSTAIAVIDENGHDRLLLGETLGLLGNDGKFYKRERAFSLLIHESNGDERGGMGVFDSGKAVVVLDRKRPDSDGVGMIVDDQLDFAGLSVNHKMKDGRYVQGMAFGIQRGTGFINLDDTSGTRRFSLMLPPTGDPKGEVYNKAGFATKDLFKAK